jgi:F-type H+-transporting ATPase subunit epsilon
MLKIKIASPDKTFFNGDAYSITIKTIDGVITVLPKHIPLVSIIKDGYVRVKDQEQIDIKSGFITVNKDSSVDVLISEL